LLAHNRRGRHRNAAARALKSDVCNSVAFGLEINHELVTAQRIASLRLVGCIVEHAIVARMLDVIHDEIIVRVCESHDFLWK
jgi:hypothetical protein